MVAISLNFQHQSQISGSREFLHQDHAAGCRKNSLKLLLQSLAESWSTKVEHRFFRHEMLGWNLDVVACWSKRGHGEQKDSSKLNCWIC